MQSFILKLKNLVEPMLLMFVKIIRDLIKVV